jgi:serine/threonine-protein kinase
LPATGGGLRQAAALTRRAAVSDPSAHSQAYPWFLFARGLAEYREGKFDQAFATMRDGASRLNGPKPRLVLAKALHRVGQFVEARKTLAAVILSFDWNATQARNHDVWICHLLRREAEVLVISNLAAFRRGEYQPRDNDEGVALLAGQLTSCEFAGLQGTAARLYSDSFAAKPDLAEDVPAATRYFGARAAASAGSGQGKDADRLHDRERALIRRQALDWLHQDLNWCGKRLDDGDAGINARIRQGLQFWWGDPDLAGVHAKDALARLPGKEREQRERLWSDVDALLRRVSDSE